MMRAPASVVLFLLHQEADRSGDNRYRIAPATLRSWVFRGRIQRHKGGYDLREILDYITRRDGCHSVSA